LSWPRQGDPSTRLQGGPRCARPRTVAHATQVSAELAVRRQRDAGNNTDLDVPRSALLSKRRSNPPRRRRRRRAGRSSPRSALGDLRRPDHGPRLRASRAGSDAAGERRRR
jgi:hypothetical protein